MKRSVLLPMLMLVNVAIAQISPENKSQLKLYFEDNIATLDPIEGIYDVAFEHWSETSYRKNPSEFGDGDRLMIYKDPTGVFKFFENSDVTIKRITGNIYSYTTLFKKSNSKDVKRFVLSENGFEVVMSIPEADLRYHLGGRYPGDGFQEHFKLSYIKVYPTEQMYRKIESNIQQEEPTEWSGTGFALNGGYVVTNYHVIDGANSIIIQGVKGDFKTFYEAIVIGKDKNNDLALLKISDSKFSGFGNIPYSISFSTSEVGEDVFVLGYPLISTMGEEIKLTTGVISSKTGFQGDVALYQISAPLQPGNSGGPLFDKRGNVIGVVNAKHADAENVGYAIKSIYLRNLIESCANLSIVPNNNIVAALPLVEKVKIEKNFVFFVRCSSSATMISNSTRIITNPVDSTRTMGAVDLCVNSITLSPTETILDFSIKSLSGEDWINIIRDAYIQVLGVKYKLTKKEGVAFYPAYTFFSYPNQTLKFKLYFPAIPTNAEKLDFIESPESPWKIYGLKLK